jgi:hypothetical protein
MSLGIWRIAIGLVAATLVALVPAFRQSTPPQSGPVADVVSVRIIVLSTAAAYTTDQLAALVEAVIKRH